MRHVRVSGDKGIKDLSIATADIKSLAITTSKIGSALTQGGTAQTGSYWVYAAAYGAVPRVIAMTNGKQGTLGVCYPIYVDNITTGSCVPRGSPGGVLQVMAIGNR